MGPRKVHPQIRPAEATAETKKSPKSVSRKIAIESNLTLQSVTHYRPTNVLLREAITPNPAPDTELLRNPYVSGSKTSDNKTEAVTYYDVIGHNPIAPLNVFHWPHIASSTAQASIFAGCNALESCCSSLSAKFCSNFCSTNFAATCGNMCCTENCSIDMSKKVDRESCCLIAAGKAAVACICCPVRISSALLSHTIGYGLDKYVIHPVYQSGCGPERQNMDENETKKQMNALGGLTQAQKTTILKARGLNPHLPPKVLKRRKETSRHLPNETEEVMSPPTPQENALKIRVTSSLPPTEETMLSPSHMLFSPAPGRIINRNSSQPSENVSGPGAEYVVKDDKSEQPDDKTEQTRERASSVSDVVNLKL